MTSAQLTLRAVSARLSGRGERRVGHPLQPVPEPARAARADWLGGHGARAAASAAVGPGQDRTGPVPAHLPGHRGDGRCHGEGLPHHGQSGEGGYRRRGAVSGGVVEDRPRFVIGGVNVVSLVLIVT